MITNDEIDIVDALLIAQHYVDLNPRNFDEGAADTNGDGAIDIVDALLISQFYVNLISELPGCDVPTNKPTSEPNVTPIPGNDEVDGYAASAGTTGGGNASPITVSSASDFKSAVGNNNPAVIIVNGRLNVGTIKIGSNKTIIGADSNAGLYGGDIQVQGSNYIFKNLTFGPSGNDAMEISGGSKVFVTKCTFHDSTDELCSIVRGADFVTISWSKFYFDNSGSHSFAHLISSSDGSTGDRGKLHVTLHHNWYGKGISGRIPRVRFGYVHIYNNYINSPGTGYCIGTGFECHIRVENTHFDDVSNAWKDMGGASNGVIGWDNLLFENASQPTYMPNKYPAFDLPYSYNLDSVNDVKSIVTAGAGNR